MRLTHLKLAGFKSFVDSTTLHIHGQRVGVVGPNGCGKSNVMESVRWVLGESSAKEMRADAMDAVIFNGSGNRKPISRASVELVFDNSLGGASGEWSQYAEISVKRVIERDKGSTYYINNTVVRRRDVADLFLGTGLGGRAYAIIGQNTISRIVEAKPEDMRVFLEEAAGVSKYKERRRETELRLRDTRENLARVEDILRELDKQIVRLQSQAAVAEQFQRLQSALDLTKGQIGLLKKRLASAEWEASQVNVKKFVTRLEAQMASLRHAENGLETARQEHTNASEAVHLAQGVYYEANAVVSNLENQVKNTSDARERIQLQLKQLLEQVEKNSVQKSDLENALSQTEKDLVTATETSALTDTLHKQAQEEVALKTQQFQIALSEFSQSQSSLINTQQKAQLEQSSLSHLTRSVAETGEQLNRLQQHLDGLVAPDERSLIDCQSELVVAEKEISTLEVDVAQSVEKEQLIQAHLKQLRAEAHAEQRALHVLEAEFGSLTKLQASLCDQHESTIKGWLSQFKLNGDVRIWQMMRIEPGWETAFEAVLGVRLNAIAANQPVGDGRPPIGMAVAWVNAESDQKIVSTYHEVGLSPLYSKLERVDARYASVLDEWLSGVYCLNEGVDVLPARQFLKRGECVVNQYGDVYTQNSVTYFGAQSSLHGVLERQARLLKLSDQLPTQQRQLEKANAGIVLLEADLQGVRAQQVTLQQLLKNATQRFHQLNLKLQQIKQQQQHVLQRKASLEADIGLAQERLKKLQHEKVEKEALLECLSASLSQLQQDTLDKEGNKQSFESVVNVARNALQKLEHQRQENGFSVKFISNNINELKLKVNQLLEEKSSLHYRGEELNATLAATKMETLKLNLESALNAKHASEANLVDARNKLQERQDCLAQMEQQRLQHEHALHPLRDLLEASRLAEQEARLHFEQCQIALIDLKVSESVLDESLRQLPDNDQKVSSLERKRVKLEADIEALGAVNLAAIHELNEEQARKNYLDEQNRDLNEASQTLENAILKIDRETRGRLKATFDEANLHFSELFTTLFGGGQARLEMLGDEILDTGVQVFAQPPGKKNSTIHLLSGGEKALTAIALVFALFRLNPAPFCLMDEVDAPLDDSNTERFCAMVKKMSERTQFLYVSHNKITMEMAQQLIGVTMQESGVSRVVDVDMEAAVKMAET